MSVNVLPNKINQKFQLLKLTEVNTLVRKVRKRLSLTDQAAYGWVAKRLLVSHKHKFIYCPVYKVASSSMMKLMLLANEPKREEELLKLSRTKIRTYVLINYSLDSYSDKKLSCLINGDYFKFIFVRNPWARLVSTYSNYFVTSRSWGKNSDIAISTAKYFYGNASTDSHASTISFRQFVEYVHATKDTEVSLDRHCISQSVYAGKINYDFIGRIENFAQDLQKITTILKLENVLSKATLIKENTTSYASSRDRQRQNHSESLPEELYKLKKAFPLYQDFYTPELIEMVRERYRNDIERFSYDFE